MRALGIGLLALALLGGVGCGGETREAHTPSVATVETTSARTESSKALVKRYLDEVWQKNDVAAVPKFFATDLVNHAAIPEAQGAAGMQTIVQKLRTAFPDLTMTASSVTAEDDMVVVRGVFEGTHRATLDFKNPILATNKHVKIDQVHTFRIRDGRIVETWMVMDKLELFSQLGVGPGAERKP